MLKLLNLSTWKLFNYTYRIKIKQSEQDNLYIPGLIYLPYIYSLWSRIYSIHALMDIWYYVTIISEFHLVPSYHLMLTISLVQPKW